MVQFPFEFILEFIKFSILILILIFSVYLFMRHDIQTYDNVQI